MPRCGIHSAAAQRMAQIYEANPRTAVMLASTSWVSRREDRDGSVSARAEVITRSKSTAFFKMASPKISSNGHAVSAGVGAFSRVFPVLLCRAFLMPLFCWTPLTS